MPPVAESLRLIPLGAGAAYGRSDEAQSGYLVVAGDRAICLDMGAGVFNRLLARWPPGRLDAVIVSHMHPDHCVDLIPLRVYMAWGSGAPGSVRVIGPTGLVSRLAALGGDGGWGDAVRFEALPARGDTDLGDGLVVRHAAVPHTNPTYALRVEWCGSSLCYSADCAPNDALPELARGCDVLLAECSYGAGAVPPGVPHLDAAAAGAMARRAGARRLLLTHCYPEYDREAARAAAAAAFGGPVAWAREGEEVAVSPG
jgi:ribonuclease BN (tRNA processing enzyme)